MPEVTSDTRIFFRINPCGLACTREWINVKTGQTETCRTFDKVTPQNKTIEKIFMVDPLAAFHNKNHDLSEKPYIEVKKHNLEPFVSEDLPLGSVDTPMLSKNSRSITENMMVPEPVPVSKPDLQTMGVSIGGENGMIFDPVPGFEQAIHIPNTGRRSKTIPEPVSLFEPAVQTIGTDTLHGNIFIPEPVSLFKPDVQPVNIGRETVMIPEIEPVSLFKPDIQTMNIDNGERNVMIPEQTSHFSQDFQTTSIGTEPAIQKFGTNVKSVIIPESDSNIQSLNNNIAEKNVIMLGGNDPELNSLLLTLLGANKIELPSFSIPRRNEATEIKPLITKPIEESLTPTLLKTSKPILKRKGQFGFELMQNKEEPHILAATVPKWKPLIQQHSMHPDILIFNKNQSILRKTSGKPDRDHSLIQRKESQITAGQFRQKENNVLRSNLITESVDETWHTKKLYPETDLIPKGVKSKPLGLAISQRAHLHVPIRKDKSTPKPILNAKPPLSR